MAINQRTRDPSERTEQVWRDEMKFILARSTIATEGTLRRRRKHIERRGPTYPLHLLSDAGQIIADADLVARPDRWLDLGPGIAGRPAVSISSRARSEWYWIRGRDPLVSRAETPIQVKAAVIERDWPHCQICGGEVGLNEHHLDHVIHHYRGGPATVDNLRLAHDLCNIQRGVRD